jgi:LuxR family maltose regulon positive regulatory protein
VTTPLLTTKLYVPPVRPNLVPRPRLVERLNEGPRSGRKLTLVSAPAGFGKTTLVSEWCRGAGSVSTPVRSGAGTVPVPAPIQAAWLSVDEGDNDPARFLAYLIAALQTVEGNIGQESLAALQSPQPPPVEAVLTSLINELAAIPEGIILVLDDYHVIGSSSIDGWTPRPVHVQWAPAVRCVMLTRWETNYRAHVAKDPLSTSRCTGIGIGIARDVHASETGFLNL